MQTKYHLEYSEEQGCFHYANNNSVFSPTYKVICTNLSDNQCSEFVMKMLRKYHKINTGDKPVPNFETIKNEFELFLLS